MTIFIHILMAQDIPVCMQSTQESHIVHSYTRKMQCIVLLKSVIRIFCGHIRKVKRKIKKREKSKKNPYIQVAMTLNINKEKAFFQG